MHNCVYMFMYIRACVHMQVCAFMCMYVSGCVNDHMFVFVECTCMYRPESSLRCHFSKDILFWVSCCDLATLCGW